MGLGLFCSFVLDEKTTVCKRMRGQGPFADLISQRFAIAYKRLGYGRLNALDCSQFVAPRQRSPQIEMF